MSMCSLLKSWKRTRNWPMRHTDGGTRSTHSIISLTEVILAPPHTRTHTQSQRFSLLAPHSVSFSAKFRCVVPREVEGLKQITKQQVIDFFDKHILQKSTRCRLSVQLFAKKWEKERLAAAADSSYRAISNFTVFKRTMPLFPTTSNNEVLVLSKL